MAVIEPKRGRGEKLLPAQGVLLVNPAEAEEAVAKVVADGGERRPLFNSRLCVDSHRDHFLAGPAVGAPVAVMALEKLVALGARRVLLCGWCGAVDRTLRVGDVVVPDCGIVGEGTSQYYGVFDRSAPSALLSEQLAARLSAAGLPVARGTLWSTDGIYREEREELLRLHHDCAVRAVDMEFSALCSAAAFRGVEFAAALTVSDVTTAETWQPGWREQAFRCNSRRVVELLCSGAVFAGEG